MVKYTNKLSEILFIELKAELIKDYFSYDKNENIDFPILAKRLVRDATSSNYGEGFSISYIIEGMAFLLGADPQFKYNPQYIKLLNSKDKIMILKKIIADEVKKNFIEDAYILLKGLLSVEASVENFKKALMLAFDLGEKDKSYLDEQKILIDEAKNFKPFPELYLYQAMLEKEEGDVELSLLSMNKFVNSGGEITEEITTFMEELSVTKEYELGKELAISDPLEGIKLLLPLLEKFEKNTSIYYYIAVAYRNLKSFEKAIYYLNEAIVIDNNVVEIFNELGLNYASIEDYDSAIAYFRKAFEATRSLEICSNLILCYYNIGNIEQAKLHLEIAKKITPNDEIIGQLEQMLKGK